MSAPEKVTLSSLPRGELEALAERLLADNAALKQAVAELRAEVATLKGLKGRPRIKPSGMEQGTEPEPAAKDRERGVRGKVGRLTIHEERLIKANVPVSSRFKGGACPRAGRGRTRGKTSWSRTWCCARAWSACAASAG
jgi:hypothetical protein